MSSLQQKQGFGPSLLTWIHLNPQEYTSLGLAPTLDGSASLRDPIMQRKQNSNTAIPVFSQELQLTWNAPSWCYLLQSNYEVPACSVPFWSPRPTLSVRVCPVFQHWFPHPATNHREGRGRWFLSSSISPSDFLATEGLLIATPCQAYWHVLPLPLEEFLCHNRVSH